MISLLSYLEGVENFEKSWKGGAQNIPVKREEGGNNALYSASLLLTIFICL